MTVENYIEFLESKTRKNIACGFEPTELYSGLFDFQTDIVRWACKKGKSAIFAGTGLGKTAMQLSWADQVCKHTNKPVLILAPLAVSTQTVQEGVKFGIPVNICRTQSDVIAGINITNYEMLGHFDPASFVGVVLDESSVLKNFSGKIRTQIIDSFRNTQYKLSCTATPSPNDHMELGNQAEFLGVMTRNEMLATYFVHDGGNTSAWRLKGHAVKSFWEFIASWAVMLQNPRDLGYNGEKFDLPPLTITQHTVEPETSRFQGRGMATTLNDRRMARRESMDLRIAAAAELINNTDSWLVWCDLNDESKALAASIPGAVEVTGSDSPEYKESTSMRFVNGEIKVLVSKPAIFGMGLNYQHCHNMIFVGLSDSFEAIYQATRRCWRFGQKHPVNVHIITSKYEGAVVKNIKEKEARFNEMLFGMIAQTQEITKTNIKQTCGISMEYKTDIKTGELWEMRLGDNIEQIKSIPDNSIHYSIFSPPFNSLYTYSNSPRDIGNCIEDEEFEQHFSYLVSELFRVMIPGRDLSIHCMDLPSSKERDGVIGLKDFSGLIIRMFQNAGFVYHSKVCIWKDPVVAMQRTKALGLLWKQLKKDSSMSRQGIPDYIITFRKPGENPEPVSHTETGFPVDKWQKYASPVWMDINPSHTLQRESAREDEDERHICPLQLDVIERCIELWSNPGDIVMDPFAGIGSTLYQALLLDRRGLGFELKESYFIQAVENCKRAEKNAKVPQSKLDSFINTNQTVIC